MIKISIDNRLSGSVIYTSVLTNETIPLHYFEPGMLVRCNDKRERLVAKVHFEYGYKVNPHWTYKDKNNSLLHVTPESEYRWSAQKNKRLRFKKGQKFNFVVSSGRRVNGTVVSQTSLDDVANVYLIDDQNRELYEIRASVLEKIAEGQKSTPSNPLQKAS